MRRTRDLASSKTATISPTRVAKPRALGMPPYPGVPEAP